MSTIGSDDMTRFSDDVAAYRYGEIENFSARQFGIHFRGGTVRASIIALVTSAIGAGLFTMPYGMKCAGLALGLLLLSFAAYTAFVSIRILLQCIQLHSSDSYSSIVSLLISPTLGFTVDLAIFMNGAFSGFIFLVFLSDFISDLIAIVGPEFHANHPIALKRIIILFSAVVTSPLSMQKNYKKLKKLTLLYVGGLLFTTVVVAFKTPSSYKSLPDVPIRFFNFDRHTLKSFNLFIFGFMQHQNVVAISQDMTYNTLQDFDQIALGAALIEFAIYGTLATCGYLSFKDQTNQNFITNYAHSDKAMILCRSILIGCLLCCIPMSMISTGISFRKILRISSKKVARGVDYLSNRMYQATDLLEEPLTTTSASQISDEQQTTRIETRSSRVWSILVVYTLEIAAALCVTQVATAISLIGGFLSAYLMSFIPLIILWKCPENSTLNLPYYRDLTVLLVATGIFCHTSILTLLG